MKQKLVHSLILFSLLLNLGGNVFAQLDPPEITSVSIEPSGAVSIFWLPNPAPEVIGYILYREINDEDHSGFYPIKEDLGPTEYTFTDTEVDARISSVSYYMESRPSSAAGTAHTTIYLHKVAYDSCKMTNTLTWNHYSGWESGAYYNIYDGNNNIVASGYSDSVYVHPIQPGLSYTYYIRAIENKTPPSKSTSNQVSIYTTPIKRPNEADFYINNIGYDGSSVNFSVNIDNTADLLGHALMVSNNETSGYSEVGYREFDKTSSIIEFSHTAENQPLFYMINAVGVCHDSIPSKEVAQPIVLNASSDETEVTLNWNKSYIESDESYSVNILKDGENTETISLASSPITIFYQDLDPDNLVEAFQLSIRADEISGNTSFSDTVLVSRLPKIEIPNAFSPNQDGRNDYFGPFDNYIKNVVIAEFKVIIYDKYGGALFSETNPKRVWGGDVKGKYVPEGGYIYYLWFKTAQGKTYEKSGAINVVYP